MGYKRALQPEDIYDLERENKTKYLIKVFVKTWIPAIQKAKLKSMNNKEKAKPTISVVGPILKTFVKQLVLLGAVKFLVSFIPFISPIILDWLISFINNDQPNWIGYLYASLMFIAPMIESLINNQYEMAINVISMRIRACFISIIYKKVC